MTSEQFYSLIKQLSDSSTVPESDILDSLAESANLKFGKITSGEERTIIDRIKSTLITGYFIMPNHSYVTSRPDYKVKFRFDDIDMKYLAQAGTELRNEGLIDGNGNYTALTPNGILLAKRLKGHL